jgi:hypothetical protein
VLLQNAFGSADDAMAQGTKKTALRTQLLAFCQAEFEKDNIYEVRAVILLTASSCATAHLQFLLLASVVAFDAFVVRVSEVCHVRSSSACYGS